MLKLTRPLVSLDLETTGTDVTKDRIVQIGLVIYNDDDDVETWSKTIYPGIPIPAAATEVHGITDADVVACPTFVQIADAVLGMLSGVDLTGFNLRSYDLPLLIAELERCGRTLPLDGVRIIDSKVIYHLREPRNLEAAVLRYCGYSHADAHDASADAEAALNVLRGQMLRYPDLPCDLDELHALCAGNAIDLSGKFVWDDQGRACIGFGKHQGTTLAMMAAGQSGYLQWMLKGEFPSDTKAIARHALNGILPVRQEITS